MTALEALRQLVEDADAFEAEAKRLGLWDENEWGATVIRAIQKYRAIVERIEAAV